MIGQKLKSLDAKLDNLRWSSRNPNSGRKAPTGPCMSIGAHGHTHINSK